MTWCFALINDKLAEIFFERKKGKVTILGHCYVKKSEYETLKEKQWIQEDTQRSRFLYRDGVYKKS